MININQNTDKICDRMQRNLDAMNESIEASNQMLLNLINQVSALYNTFCRIENLRWALQNDLMLIKYPPSISDN